MSRDMGKSTNALFENFADYLSKHLEKISVDGKYEGSVADNFDRDLHWNKLGLCFQSVSKECTKLAVGYSKHPAPDLEASQSLINSLKEAVNILLAWFDTFPLSEGRMLHVELTKLVFSLLEAIQTLMLSIRLEGPSESNERLHKTGKIWECCKTFPNIPKDNRSAAESRLSGAIQLVEDAYAEIKEELSADCDDPENESWTDHDKSLFEPCLKLIELSKKTIRMIVSCIKVKGNTKDLKSIKEFDVIVELVDKISPSVDDLVLSLYPPVDHSNVQVNAKALADRLEEAIQTSRSHHYLEERYFRWLDVITTDLKQFTSMLGEVS